MTAAAGQPGTPPAARPRPSVRHAGLATGPVVALAGLVAASLAVFGFRLLAPAYPGGDLLYHGALALGLVREGLPMEGAYAGLPAYYPPGFHALLGGLIGALGIPPVTAAAILFVLLLPALPLGTYLLANRLTGRPWVAVLAVALTLFGGAYDLNPGRQWVNSLFMGGHAAWTAYPRDLVFAILPFAAYAFVRALEPGAGGRRWLAWAAVGGLILGGAALVQVQLLLPIPFAFPALVVAARDPARRGRALVALAVTGGLALLLAAPWLIQTADTIRQNGGVALDSSDQLEPAQFGFWSYPRQFGLLLPFGVLGAGAALLFLRRPDGPRPAGEPGPWHPSLREAGVLLATWWALPFVLGVLYQPTWPLEDALRPQRLWLIASQPLALLAAIGMVTASEHVLLRRRPRWVVPAIVVTVVAASLPATYATASLVARSWTQDVYAMLDREADRVPQFDALLGRTGPRVTVVAPEDWSAWAWFETGQQIVAFVPPGYAKLAFDPAIFTGTSQADRRAALVAAWSGDVASLVAAADRFGAQRIVIPREADRWSLVDLAAAAVVADDPGAAPGARIAEGNGWDAVELAEGQRLLLPTRTTGPLDVAVKVATLGGGVGPAVSLRLVAVSAVGEGADGGAIVGEGPGRSLAVIDLPASADPGAGGPPR